MLVGALHILASDCISPVDLDRAQALLLDFYQLFPELYSESYNCMITYARIDGQFIHLR